MGLVTDIQAPDLETRVAILRAKASRENITLPEDVMFLIAERIQRNVRELEGCLVRLSALSHLLHAPITADLALEVLRVYSRPPEGAVDVSRIQQQVAREFDVSVESLRGKRRTSAIALARQVAIYLTKRLTPLTLIEIGKNYGNRDHSTVLYAVEKVQTVRKNNPLMDQRVERLERDLRANPS